MKNEKKTKIARAQQDREKKRVAEYKREKSKWNEWRAKSWKKERAEKCFFFYLRRVADFVSILFFFSDKIPVT